MPGLLGAGGNKLLTTRRTKAALPTLTASLIRYSEMGAARKIISSLTPASPANGATGQTSYSFYDANGLLVRSIDPTLFLR